MKTIPNLILLAGLATAISLRAVAQSADEPAQDSAPPSGEMPPGPPPGEEPAAQPAEQNAAEGSNPRAIVQVFATNSDTTAQNSSEPAPAAGATAGSDQLRLNFRGVSLEMVLNYLSDAAGFIIVEDTPVHGNVDVWSGQPLSKDEAVDLLNTVLDKNGYAAVRNGRTLTIVNKDDAKTKDIPVVSGSDPDQIPQTDEMITQIIPVRFVEAAQLIKDIQPLVSLQSTITANEAGNAVVITDTRANIHRVAEIIKDIDIGAQAVTEVRVFHLAYADPVEMATLLGNLFPSDSSSTSQTPVRFGGGGGRFGGFFGGFGGGGGGGGGNTGGASSSTSDRIKKMQRVIAVADQRTASVVVSAPNDLMDQISRMISQLDNNPAKKQNVYVFHLENADPEEVLPVLQDMFQKNTTSRSSSRSTSQSPLMSRSTTTATSGTASSSPSSSGIGGSFGGGGGGGGGGARTGGGGGLGF